MLEQQHRWCAASPQPPDPALETLSGVEEPQTSATAGTDPVVEVIAGEGGDGGHGLDTVSRDLRPLVAPKTLLGHPVHYLVAWVCFERRHQSQERDHLWWRERRRGLRPVAGVQGQSDSESSCQGQGDLQSTEPGQPVSWLWSPGVGIPELAFTQQRMKSYRCV